MTYAPACDANITIFKERAILMHLDKIKFVVASHENMKKTKDQMCGRLIINNAIQRAMYGQDIIFVINEEVFDRMSDDSQIIMVDKLLAQVSYDLEKESIKKSAPDIQEHSAILQKYTFNMLLSVSAEITQIYEKLAEEAD
jgi:pyruvate/2-oxoglutarate/acetoin dehydrogenase E1 component